MQQKNHLSKMIVGLLRRIDTQERRLPQGIRRDHCQIIYRQLRGTQASLRQTSNVPFADVPFGVAIITTIKKLEAEIRDMDGVEDYVL